MSNAARKASGRCTSKRPRGWRALRLRRAGKRLWATPVARLLRSPSPERIYELAGPRIYTYRSLLRVLGAGLDKEPVLLPLPFALWKFIGAIGELLPAPPVTRNQVELMERENIASPSVPGFASLQMVPRSLEEVLPQLSEGRI